MSKKAKATAPASSQGEAGPASAPAEIRDQAAPKPTAPAGTRNAKRETRNSEAGTPAAKPIPNEAQIEAQFLAELENSLPAEIDGVAPKRTTQRPAAADQSGDEPDGVTQEAPADEQADQSDQSDQSYPSDQQTPDDATDETGVDPETTNEQEDDRPDEEDLGALAALDEAQLDAHAQDRQWPASYLKRVKKFTKQLRAAEARADRLEAEAERENPEPETRNPEPGSNAGGPGAGAVSARETQLAGEIAQHEEWLAQIDEVEPGGSLVVGEQTFGPVQLRKARRALETKLASRTLALETAQNDRADQVRAGEAEAVVRHPWLKDRSNPDTALIQNVMHQYPVLAQIPSIRRLLADALTYRKLVEKAKAQAGNGNGNGNGKFHVEQQAGTRNPKPATVARGPARPAAAVLPAPRRATDLSGRLAKVMETGSRKDAESILMDLVEK